jgi:putative mRNA 3-end processing factor
MALRGTKRRKAADKGFALFDHADWPGLNDAIKATGASRIFVTHGYTNTYMTWLRSQGYEAHTVKTQFEDGMAELEGSGEEKLETEEATQNSEQE